MATGCARRCCPECVRPSSRARRGGRTGGFAVAGRALRAGLGFRASASEYRAANPEIGGDPKQLNDPSLIDDACFQECTFTRRVTDLAGGGSWRVVSDLPAGAVLTATPSQFTLAAGATQSVSFRIDVRAPQLPGSWLDGRVRFERVTNDDVADAAIPVKVFADPGELPPATIATATEAGYQDLTLSGLVALPDAHFAGTALVPLDAFERSIGPDYGDDPYDSFVDGAIQRSITVPASPGTAFRLVVTTRSTASDVDLFVGRDANGDGAELGEELCRSTGASSSELCAVDIVGTDDEQTYWAVAQNLPSFDEGVDPVRLESALVDMDPNADGALVVTGPGHTASGESFDLRVGFEGRRARARTTLREGDILFIDEIHRLRPIIEEFLYPAMEDWRIDVRLSDGPHAQMISMPVEPFTLVGATTRFGLLTAPMLQRGLNHFAQLNGRNQVRAYLSLKQPDKALPILSAYQVGATQEVFDHQIRGRDAYPELETLKRELAARRVEFQIRRLTNNKNEVTAFGIAELSSAEFGMRI